MWLAVLVGGAAGFLWRRGQRRLALFLVATAAGGGVVTSLVKVAVGRLRPELDHVVATAFGQSFPSGHAMSSTVVYGSLLLAFLPARRARRRAALAGAVALVLAVGCSRLVLGVHLLADLLR